jgi:hypothetical protein
MPDPKRPLSDGKIAALKLLKQAHDDAEDAQEEPRQFAATKDELLAAGATASDLLWMIRMRYVEHVLDITRDGESRRQFRGATTPQLGANSCFVLTHLGKVCLETKRRERSATMAKPASRSMPARLPAERISWIKQRHELTVDGKVAKRFKHSAPAQWQALDLFQADGWRGPIEASPTGDPLRDYGQRLRELVKELNQGLDTSLIHFRKDCETDRITFDLP